MGSAPSRRISRAAATWPVLECLVTTNWREEGELVQVLVARRSPEGVVAAGIILVDLGCLGVKNALGRTFASRLDYEDELRDAFVQRQPVDSVDLDLAARIVREGIAYAARFGFKPHRDYHQAAVLLAGADPDARNEIIPLGKDGMPYFISGPSTTSRASWRR